MCLRVRVRLTQCVLFKLSSSPVPELSLHRGWTGEERVQDNLHAHASYPGLSLQAPGFNPYIMARVRESSGTGLAIEKSETWIDILVVIFLQSNAGSTGSPFLWLSLPFMCEGVFPNFAKRNVLFNKTGDQFC